MLLTYRRATQDDLPAVFAVLDEAAQWLRAQGIEQWPASFSQDDGWRQTRIGGYIDAGETWLVQDRDETAATFTLGGPDPDYAEGWPNGPDSATYLYRMAVRRNWAGCALGPQIIDWASGQAAAKGHRWLRLDCHRENRALQLYYEHQGFERVGTVVKTIDDHGKPYTRGSGALYQRPAGTASYECKETTVSDDRYDPTGKAAIWQAASNLVAELKRPAGPGDELDEWNTALDQAARALENEARAIRQEGGMYYRVTTGRDGAREGT